MAVDTIARGMAASAAAKNLPPVTAVDNGKLLRVVNGKWTAKTDHSVFEFVTDTDNQSVTIRYIQSGSSTVNVDWGDGAVSSSPYLTALETHAYSRAGTHQVTISSIDGAIWSPGDGTNGFSGGKLISAALSASVTSIGQYAFYNCTSLASVEIPDSVTRIEDVAFYGCTGLASITSLNTTPPSISENTFGNVPAACPIYVPAASVAAYQAASIWSDRAAYIQAIPA